MCFRPSTILAKSNIDRVYCNDIVRQENKDTKEAVESIIAGDVAGALEKINNATTNVDRTSSGTAISERCGHNVVELTDINNYSDAGDSDAIDALRLNPPHNAKSIQELDRLAVLEAAANDYLSRSLDERNKTIVIVDAHADREIIHDKIRDGLKQQGHLVQEGVTATRLVSLGLTQGALHDINIFETSQVVDVNGQHFTICDVDKEAGSITLEDTHCNTSILLPEHTNKSIELYEPKQVELCQGDIIRSTRTDKARGIVAGTQYQVMETNNATIKLADLHSQNERTLTLNDLQDAHWDYAYSATGYSAQGSTCQSVIDVKFSWRSNLSSMRALYVSISRAINNVTVYTDSKDELVKRLNKSKSTNNKTAAIEATSGKAITASVFNEQAQDQEAEVNAKPHYNPAINSKRQTHNHEAGHAKVANPEVNVHEPQKQHKQSIDANALQLALANDAREVATSILGEPNQKLSNASNLRFGSKGSMSVNIAGKHQGKFHDFETGESGNMIQLIQNELGLEFKEALEYGQRMVGGALLHLQVQPKTKSKPIADNQPSKTAKWAARIIDTAKPIKGTLAERYLREHRHINKVSGKDLKFHPKVFVGKDEKTGKSAYAPALVAIARDINGKYLSAQVTYLDKATAKKLNTDIQKRTLGKISGKAVTLSGSKENQPISFIAEGVETGLSVQEAIKGAHVLASLGKQNMKNIDPQLLAKQVILIADNDGKALNQDKQLLEAAARFKHAGKDVHIVMPEPIDAKTDLNDILREKGVGGLKQTLAATVKVDDDRVNSDHTHDDQQTTKRFNSNNTHDSGAGREAMQRYHDMTHKQQQKHAVDKLQQPLHGDIKPDHSVAQRDRQVQIDREI